MQKVDRHTVAVHGVSGCKLAIQLWLQKSPRDCLSRQQMGWLAGLICPWYTVGCLDSNLQAPGWSKAHS